MADVTIVTAANWIGEVWPPMVLEALRTNPVIADKLDRKWERFLTAGGDKVNVGGLAAIAAGTLTNMTGNISFTANTEGTTQIVVNTLAYAAVTLDDPAKIQSNVSMQPLYTDRLGYEVQKKIDTDCLTEMDTATQAVGTDNVDLTDDNVKRAIQYVDDGNGDPSDRFMAISPATLMSFFGVEKYANSLYRGTTGELKTGQGRGFKGRVYDADVYETTNLPAGAAGKKNFYWQREAVALIIQKSVKVDVWHADLQLNQRVVAWAMYGLKKMRDAVIVEMDGK